MIEIDCLVLFGSLCLVGTNHEVEDVSIISRGEEYQIDFRLEDFKVRVSKMKLIDTRPWDDGLDELCVESRCVRYLVSIDNTKDEFCRSYYFSVEQKYENISLCSNSLGNNNRLIEDLAFRYNGILFPLSEFVDHGKRLSLPVIRRDKDGATVCIDTNRQIFVRNAACCE